MGSILYFVYSQVLVAVLDYFDDGDEIAGHNYVKGKTWRSIPGVTLAYQQCGTFYVIFLPICHVTVPGSLTRFTTTK
jgi:hypothetical protein